MADTLIRENHRLVQLMVAVVVIVLVPSALLMFRSLVFALCLGALLMFKSCTSEVEMTLLS